MDILAAMFAYLVCVTGIVTAVVMWFVVLFSAPGQFSAPPAQAIAMAATQHPIKAARTAPGKTVDKTIDKTIAQAGAADKQTAAAAKGNVIPPPTIAIDARQKPLFSQSHLRRLAEKERARQLAYRERSSFEARFLHYDD